MRHGRRLLMHECGIRVNQLSQTMAPAAEHWQHSRNVVLGYATGIEQDVDAGAPTFIETPVVRTSG